MKPPHGAGVGAGRGYAGFCGEVNALPRQQRSGACDPRALCANCEITLVAKVGALYCAACKHEKDQGELLAVSA